MTIDGLGAQKQIACAVRVINEQASSQERCFLASHTEAEKVA